VLLEDKEDRTVATVPGSRSEQEELREEGRGTLEQGRDDWRVRYRLGNEEKRAEFPGERRTKPGQECY
jgi:hypothetical protein